MFSLKNKILIVVLITISLIYFFLVFSWVNPGVKGKFYDNKRKVQNYFYSKIIRDPNAGGVLHWNPEIVDVVIPVIEKDLPTLSNCIDGVRNMMMHNLGSIYLVSPPSEIKIQEFAKKNDCLFIDETKIIPNFENKVSRGWIIQQFVKLNADKIVQNNYYLVIDADTVLIRPQVFLRKGKTILNWHKDYGAERKLSSANILGIKKVHNMDFTVHHMLFDKIKLKKMKNHIENNHGKPWYDVVAMQDEISEFELYANYILNFHPKEVRIAPAHNLSILRKQFEKGPLMIATLSQKYKSVSSHEFIKEKEI